MTQAFKPGDKFLHEFSNGKWWLCTLTAGPDQHGDYTVEWFEGMKRKESSEFTYEDIMRSRMIEG